MTPPIDIAVPPEADARSVRLWRAVGWWIARMAAAFGDPARIAARPMTRLRLRELRQMLGGLECLVRFLVCAAALVRGEALRQAGALAAPSAAPLRPHIRCRRAPPHADVQSGPGETASDPASWRVRFSWIAPPLSPLPWQQAGRRPAVPPRAFVLDEAIRQLQGKAAVAAAMVRSGDRLRPCLGPGPHPCIRTPVRDPLKPRFPKLAAIAAGDRLGLAPASLVLVCAGRLEALMRIAARPAQAIDRLARRHARSHQLVLSRERLGRQIMPAGRPAAECTPVHDAREAFDLLVQIFCAIRGPIACNSS